jgi:hypothetical protein
MLLSSQHPEPSHGGSDLSETRAFGAPVALKEDDRVEAHASGSWLSLRDAVQVVGSLEHLYRLASAQKLPSRDDPDGQVEVWIADADRDAGALRRPVEAASQDEALAGIQELALAICDRILTAIAPLVANADQNLRLARENGALAERVASLEAEVASLGQGLQAVRDVSLPDGQALESMETRLQLLEDANLAIKRLLAAPRRS